MNIISAQRQANDPLTNEERTDLIVNVDGITMSIPLDPANRHYAEILRQVDEGIITIQDADSN